MHEEYEWRIAEPTHEFEFDEEGKLLRVVVSAMARATRSNSNASHSKRNMTEASATRLIDTSVSVSLHYRIMTSSPPEEMREALFTAFAAVNGRYNAWPYIREFFQSATARMGIQPLVVPVYRVPQKTKRTQTNDERATKTTRTSSNKEAHR
jgi:hypothetical protein